MSDSVFEIAKILPGKPGREASSLRQKELRQELAANLKNLVRANGFGEIWPQGMAGVFLKTMIDLEMGLPTGESITVETLCGIGKIFSHDPMFSANDEEVSCGATTTLDNLVRAGVRVTFIEN